MDRVGEAHVVMARRRGDVTEKRLRSDRQEGCALPAVPGQGMGAESINAPVHLPKAPLRQKPADGPRAEADLEELRPRYDAVLTAPDLGEAFIAILVRHPAKGGTEMVTDG